MGKLPRKDDPGAEVRDENTLVRPSPRPSSAPPPRSTGSMRALRSSVPPVLDDALVALPVPRDQIPLTSHFRSTWLSSSIQALRDRGHYDAYVRALPDDARAPILESVAGVWLPIELCVAHYRTCDALGIGRRDSWDVGVEVSRRVHGTSLARLAKQAGVTPWTVLAQMPKLWERVYRGGGVAVHRVGPKESVIEVVQWTIAPIPYVRYSMPAVVHGIVEPFCSKTYVSEVTSLASDTTLGLRVQWV